MTDMMKKHARITRPADIKPGSNKANVYAIRSKDW